MWRQLSAAALAAALVVAAPSGAARHEPDGSPGTALRAFVGAARAGRYDGMWRQLSRASRARLGPSLTRFRHGAGRRLRARIAAFSPRARLILDERIDVRLGVAAVAGMTRTRAGARYDAFAAAARAEGSRWKLELAGPVRLHAIRPNPGEQVVRRTQIAAGVAAHAPIVEAGLWLDGLAFPARGGATDPRHLTMWDEAPQPLRAGRHSVVAFASAGRTASALAWTFSVVR